MSSAARLGWLGAALTAALLTASSARADIISDEEGVCRSKAKGDACEVGGKLGACADSTCSFNDYSGGTPPKAGQRPCLQCVVGNVTKDAKGDETPAKTDDKTDARPDDKTDAKTDAKTDDKTDAKSDTKTDAKTDAKTSTPPPAGCSVDGAASGFGLALGLVLLALARRRSATGPS